MASSLLTGIDGDTPSEADSALQVQRLTGQLKAVRRMARSLEASLAQGRCERQKELRKYLEELYQLLKVYEQSYEGSTR